MGLNEFIRLIFYKYIVSNGTVTFLRSTIPPLQNSTIPLSTVHKPVSALHLKHLYGWNLVLIIVLWFLLN